MRRATVRYDPTVKKTFGLEKRMVILMNSNTKQNNTYMRPTVKGIYA